jgi:hypothetical protein
VLRDRGYWISGDHDPPHFHAWKPGEWHYVVRFLEPRDHMLVCKWEDKALPGKVRRALRDSATVHSDALVQEWHRRHEGL